MKTFLEWLGEDMTSNPYYGDIAKGLNDVSEKLAAQEVEHFKKVCKSFGLSWKVDGGDLLVGSTFRPGAHDVALDVARQAELALKDVPGGEIEPVSPDGGSARTRFVLGYKSGEIFVRRMGVEPAFMRLLNAV